MENMMRHKGTHMGNEINKLQQNLLLYYCHVITCTTNIRITNNPILNLTHVHSLTMLSLYLRLLRFTRRFTQRMRLLHLYLLLFSVWCPNESQWSTNRMNYCPYCGNKFTFKEGFRRHMKEQHPR